MTCPNTLLREVFGFDSFRPGQQEIVDAVVAGEPVLAIMPTGGGKSLCFQLPALARSGLTLVISPLIALMRDQVRALQAAGVCAGALTSANSQEESEEVLAALRDERLRLLYLAPERLASSAMHHCSNAQCISHRGGRSLVSANGGMIFGLIICILASCALFECPLAAFTATADEETRQDIIERLFEGKKPKTFLKGFDGQIFT